MEYLTIKETAEKWDLSLRRIQSMCKDGLIPGAVRFGHSWAIPLDAERPVDKRIKSGRYIK